MQDSEGSGRGNSPARVGLIACLWLCSCTVEPFSFDGDPALLDKGEQAAVIPGGHIDGGGNSEAPRGDSSEWSDTVQSPEKNVRNARSPHCQP